MSTTIMTNLAAATPVTAAPSPPPSIAKGDRLEVLDVLRGIALLGMYVVHLCDYAGVWNVPKGQQPALWQRLEWWLLDGRAYTMFAMLFGIGFAVQLARADARGDNLVPRYLRRLGALAVFGFIAEGVFGYNVLFGYAVWGLALLPIRRWSTRSIVILFLVCSAFIPLYNLSRLAIAEARGRVAEHVEDRKAAGVRYQRAVQLKDSVAESGRWPAVVAGRMRFMWHFQRRWLWNAGGSFTLMLAGLLAFRLGVFEDPARKRKVILWWMLVGGVSCVISEWALPLPGAPQMNLDALAKSATPVREMAFTTLMNDGFNVFRDSWLAFTYISAVLLLVAFNRAWLTRLAPFAWNGRMALTNYMIQIAFLDVMFEKWSFSLSVAPRWILIYAIGLFAVQAMVARWWLARYQYGPLEWVWRSVTYWQPAPFRRVDSRRSLGTVTAWS
jgi:uncharacterized protein